MSPWASLPSPSRARSRNLGRMTPDATVRAEAAPGSAGSREAVVTALLLGGALAIRLLPLTFGVESTDIGLYRAQALPVLHGENVYAVTRSVFPYTPVSMPYPALALAASAVLGVPYHLVIKLFAILSDVAIVLLFRTWGSRVLPPRDATRAALLYALSPVSILISSFHGNAMSFVVLLMLAAWVLFRVDPERNLVPAGLVLGLAIGWRSFPVLLLPFFLVSLPGLSRKARFVAAAVLPTALTTVPFLLVDAQAMLREVLGYSGIGIHHGPFGVARGLRLLAIEQLTWENPPSWAPWMSASKLAFLALWGTAALFARRIGLRNGILVTFGLFYAVYCGVASQYLVWVVPFLLVGNRLFFACWELAATFALVTFYWIFFPDILFGTLRPMVPLLESAPLLRQYVLAELLLSLLCAAGVVLFATGRGGIGPPTPAASAAPWGAPRVVGWAVALFFVLLLAWEAAFVAAL